MVVKCEIKFDQNPYGIYFAGQTIAGRIDLTLDKPKKVRGICLKITGFALAQWSQSENSGVGKNRRQRTVRYTGREDYLHSSTYLTGSNEGHQVEILPGIHTYNFSCFLPATLPTSFEGTYGHIRYTVRVALERPWKFDQTYKVAFTVLKHVDLNYDTPALRIPSQMEMVKTFCCGPCRSAPLSLTVQIPMSGYAPGQNIVITATIVNNSRVVVDEIKFLLRKIVVYYSTTPRVSARQEMIDVAENRATGVARNASGKYLQNLLIPPLPPTNISLCRVIHLTYEVIVEAKVAGPHQNPIVRIPVTIGTVPLIQQFPLGPVELRNPYSLQPAANTSNMSVVIPTAPMFNSTPISMPLTEYNGDGNSRISEIPPPSYEECVSGAVAIEDDDEQHPIEKKSYAPRYPVYSFNGNPSN